MISLLSQKNKVELDEVEKLGYTDIQIAEDYEPMSLVSEDGYLTLELGTGSVLLRGKIWRIKKFVHPMGMTELLLAQSVNARGEPGEWLILQYSNPDPNSSIRDSFDRVLRKSVDPDAGKKVYNLMIMALSGVVFLLLYLLWTGYDFRPTWELMSAIISWAILAIMFIMFENWKLDRDFVDSATLFVDAPPYPRSITVAHPITGEIRRFAGKVLPVGVKSSKIPIDRIRGYSVNDISQHIEYAKELDEYENQYMKIVLQYELDKKSILGDGLPEQEKKTKLEELDKKIQEELSVLDEKKNEILARFDEIIEEGTFDRMISDAKKRIEEIKAREKIEEELARRNKEIEEMLKENTQLKIELDKAKKELHMWMAQSNRDVNAQEAMIATRVAVATQRKALIASYSPETIPGAPEKKNLANMLNPWLIAGFIGVIVSLFVYMILSAVLSGVKAAFTQMGPWGSVVFGIVIVMMTIGIGIFFIVWLANYLKQKATGTKKVILQ